jgi:hypothetical protein
MAVAAVPEAPARALEIPAAVQATLRRQEEQIAAAAASLHRLLHPHAFADSSPDLRAAVGAVMQRVATLTEEGLARDRQEMELRTLLVETHVRGAVRMGRCVMRC